MTSIRKAVRPIDTIGGQNCSPQQKSREQTLVVIFVDLSTIGYDPESIYLMHIVHQEYLPEVFNLPDSHQAPPG